MAQVSCAVWQTCAVEGVGRRRGGSRRAYRHALIVVPQRLEPGGAAGGEQLWLAGEPPADLLLLLLSRHLHHARQARILTPDNFSRANCSKQLQQRIRICFMQSKQVSDALTISLRASCNKLLQA